MRVFTNDDLLKTFKNSTFDVHFKYIPTNTLPNIFMAELIE